MEFNCTCSKAVKMKCEYCNKDHNCNYASGRFCNQKCARGFSTRAARTKINYQVSIKLTGRKLSEVTKEKIRYTYLKVDRKQQSLKLKEYYTLHPESRIRLRNDFLKLKEAGKLFGQGSKHKPESISKIRTTLLKTNNTEEFKEKMRQIRLHHVIPKKDTKIERLLQQELMKNDIVYTPHKPILGQPDLFIEPNICIFADGEYWHNYPYGTTRDKIVTETLQHQGYKVLRFWEREINNNINECSSKILSSMRV